MLLFIEEGALEQRERRDLSEKTDEISKWDNLLIYKKKQLKWHFKGILDTLFAGWFCEYFSYFITPNFEDEIDEVFF